MSDSGLITAFHPTTIPTTITLQDQQGWRSLSVHVTIKDIHHLSLIPVDPIRFTGLIPVGSFITIAAHAHDALGNTFSSFQGLHLEHISNDFDVVRVEVGKEYNQFVLTGLRPGDTIFKASILVGLSKYNQTYQAASGSVDKESTREWITSDQGDPTSVGGIPSNSKRYIAMAYRREADRKMEISDMIALRVSSLLQPSGHLVLRTGSIVTFQIASNAPSKALSRWMQSSNSESHRWESSAPHVLYINGETGIAIASSSGRASVTFAAAVISQVSVTVAEVVSVSLSIPSNTVLSNAIVPSLGVPKDFVLPIIIRDKQNAVLSMAPQIDHQLTIACWVEESQESWAVARAYRDEQTGSYLCQVAAAPQSLLSAIRYGLSPPVHVDVHLDVRDPTTRETFHSTTNLPYVPAMELVPTHTKQSSSIGGLCVPLALPDPMPSSSAVESENKGLGPTFSILRIIGGSGAISSSSSHRMLLVRQVASGGEAVFLEKSLSTMSSPVRSLNYEVRVDPLVVNSQSKPPSDLPTTLEVRFTDRETGQILTQCVVVPDLGIQGHSRQSSSPMLLVFVLLGFLIVVLLYIQGYPRGQFYQRGTQTPGTRTNFETPGTDRSLMTPYTGRKFVYIILLHSI